MRFQTVPIVSSGTGSVSPRSFSVPSTGRLAILDESRKGIGPEGRNVSERVGEEIPCSDGGLSIGPTKTHVTGGSANT